MTGAGKVHRHVPLRSAADLEQPGLKALLAAALAAWKARTMPESIRACTSADAAAICAIYNPLRSRDRHHLRGRRRSRRPRWRSASATSRRTLPWLVAEEQGAILGYAYATPWKARSAYRFSVETTVYVAPGHMRRGVGDGAVSAAASTSCASCGVHCGRRRHRVAERGEHRAAREARLQEDRPIRRDRPQARSLGRRRLLGADPALAGGCFRTASTAGCSPNGEAGRASRGDRSARRLHAVAGFRYADGAAFLPRCARLRDRGHLPPRRRRSCRLVLSPARRCRGHAERRVRRARSGRRRPSSRASRPTRIPASTSAAPMSTARIGICVRKGIDVQEPTIAHYGMKQLYVSDPDGYLLCFQWRAEAPAP